jgi:hypothetical protein
MSGWIPNKFKIVKGRDYQIAVHLLDSDGVPITISGATAVSLLIKKADNTILEKAAYTGFASGYSNPLWIYAFLLTASETALFTIDKDQSIEIKILFGTAIQVFEITKSLTVVADNFV